MNVRDKILVVIVACVAAIWVYLIGLRFQSILLGFREKRLRRLFPRLAVYSEVSRAGLLRLAVFCRRCGTKNHIKFSFRGSRSSCKSCHVPFGQI